MQKRLRKPAPALVISLLALFLALGGTTYAATSLPKNSVGTKQLKNGAVTRTKISSGTLASLKGPKGDKGDTGAPGQDGTNGTNGTIGTNGTNGTARAWALVGPLGVVSNSHDVSSVTQFGTGDYCVELNSSVPNSSTGAVVTPYYPLDSTAGTSITHAEYDGSCGTNGVRVLTWVVSANTTLGLASANEGFFIAVP